MILRSESTAQHSTALSPAPLELDIMADISKETKPASSTVLRTDVELEMGTVQSWKGLSTAHVDGIDIVFERQAALVNHAVQAIGMGRYQWCLFGLCGFGWLCDQVRLHSSFFIPWRRCKGES
jgi:hypothetical protein